MVTKGNNGHKKEAVGTKRKEWSQKGSSGHKKERVVTERSSGHKKEIVVTKRKQWSQKRSIGHKRKQWSQKGSSGHKKVTVVTKRKQCSQKGSSGHKIYLPKMSRKYRFNQNILRVGLKAKVLCSTQILKTRSLTLGGRKNCPPLTKANRIDSLA